MGNESNPGKWPNSQRMTALSSALMFTGALTFAVTFFVDRERAWHGYLAGYYYFFILGLGGLFFVAIQHMTSAGWSVNIRRFSEAFTSYLPIAFGGGLILLLGGHDLYSWLDKANVAADPILQHKQGYLNLPFFIIRILLFFGLWLWFAKKLVGFSLDQDKSGDESLTRRALPWSIAFILIFALSFSLFSVDLLMSLEPHWFSTIFGVYCFAGLFQSTIAMLILFVIYSMKKGVLKGYVDDNHLHDLGKFLFAFTVFWAYIAYSQYMLIWYANLPEETLFYLPRVTGGWMWVSIVLLLGKFVVPFLLLLPKWAKRSMNHLTVVSIWILVMQYLDLYWLIYPNLTHNEVKLGAPEILIWAGFGGAFLFAVNRFLSRHSVVPVRDPRIQESMHHHVVY